MGIDLAGSAQMSAACQWPCVWNGTAAAVAGSSWVQAAGHRAELTIWALRSGHQPCHCGRQAH